MSEFFRIIESFDELQEEARKLAYSTKKYHFKDVVKTLRDLKDDVNKSSHSNNIMKQSSLIALYCPAVIGEMLMPFQPELKYMFQCFKVYVLPLSFSNSRQWENVEIAIIDVQQHTKKCDRCYRYEIINNGILCDRCVGHMNGIYENRLVA